MTHRKISPANKRSASSGVVRANFTPDRSKSNPQRIDLLQTITLGGIEQAIHICGDDLNLPVLLFFHGGPGLPHMPIAHANAELGKCFLVVHWDQRGTGKSFSPWLRRQDVTVEQLISDACELLAWLHRRFTPSALILVGHSWGSALGALVAARCPHHVSVFVGLGQVTNLRAAEAERYTLSLAMARQRGDSRTLDLLRRLGPPPYANTEKSDALERQASHLASKSYRPFTTRDFARLAISSPVYSWLDLLKLPLGHRFSERCLWSDIFTTVDLFRQVKRLEMPAYFLVGRHDIVVAHSLAKRYYDALVAPMGKYFVTMDRSGHWPHLEERELFRGILAGTIQRPCMAASMAA